MKTFKKNFIIFTLVFASVTLFFLVLTYAYGNWLLFKIDHTNYKNSGGPSKRFDSQLGFVSVENFKGKTKVISTDDSYDVLTDNTGARVSREEQTPLPTSPSAIATGCSFTWGQGISNDETFSKKLSEKLKMPVRNYAEPYYGSVQSYLMLERFANESNLLIYGFMDDHLYRNVTPCIRSYVPICVHVPTIKRNSQGKLYIDDHITIKDLKIPKGVEIGFNSIAYLISRFFGEYQSTLPDDERLEATEFVIRKMEEFAVKHQAKLLIVNVGIGRPKENFSALSSKKWGDHVAFVDASFFEGFNPSDLLIKNEPHPNAKANERIAERLADFIIKNGFIKGAADKDE